MTIPRHYRIGHTILLSTMIDFRDIITVTSGFSRLLPLGSFRYHFLRSLLATDTLLQPLPADISFGQLSSLPIRQHRVFTGWPQKPSLILAATTGRVIFTPCHATAAIRQSAARRMPPLTRRRRREGFWVKDAVNRRLISPLNNIADFAEDSSEGAATELILFSSTEGNTDDMGPASFNASGRQLPAITIASLRCREIFSSSQFARRQTFLD